MFPCGVPSSNVGRSEMATKILEQILLIQDSNWQYVYLFTFAVIATSALLTVIN